MLGWLGVGVENWEETMKRVAECHCRRLKAFVTGEPIRICLCHCKACQRRTGSAAHWGTRWEKTRAKPTAVSSSGAISVRIEVPLL
jgi:hypothetical protein